MKKYFSMLKNSFMVGMTYRAHFFFSILGNLIYLLLLFFLWKAIYAGAPDSMINGHTFNQSFLYISMAMAMFSFLQCWTDWGMSREIISGNIIVRLMKPIDYQLSTLFDTAGQSLLNLILITIPTVIIVIFVFKVDIPFGMNIFFFLISLFLAYFINFSLDFSIGLSAFKTESIWGIAMTKEVIVLFFSGASVPLYFFPDVLASITSYLPFQAIYHTPLTLLLNPGLPIFEVAKMMVVQLFWILVLTVFARFFFVRSSRVLMINGG